jgi:prevent-host-death family protein
LSLMKTVGVRELKNRLSEYIRRAKSGEGVLVTDRGQVVAELTPPGQGATRARRGKRIAAQLLQEERGDR